MLDPEAREDLDLAVIHDHRDIDGERTFRQRQHLSDSRLEPKRVCRFLYQGTRVRDH
jgi:hypothetical protein